MKRAFLLFLPFFLSTLVWAQHDPKAKPLLDAYLASFETATLPGSGNGNADTLDMTLCFSGPEPAPETCTRSAFDFTKKRMMTEMQGEYGFKMVYQGGKARMQASAFEEAFPMPPAEVKKLEKTFKTMFEQVQDIKGGTFVLEDVSSSRYDGRVRYGDVVAGEQITVTTAVPSFGLVAADTRKFTMRLVFNRAKEVVGTVVKQSQGTLLSVPTKPKAANAMIRMMSMTHYKLEGSKPIKQGTTRLAHYKLNEPLSESLFELTPKR